MAGVLTQSEVTAALSGDLGAWHGDVSALHRAVEFPSFPAAIDGVAAVARIAEEMNHHPDIDIRWRTVTFHVSTHSAGGVTGADLSLCRRIDQALGP